MEHTERLVEQLPALRRLASALVGADAAEDLVQDAALAALRANSSLDSNAGLRTLLRRRAVDLFRRERVRRSKGLESAPHARAPDPSPSDAHDRLERHAALIDALRALPEDDRALLVARYFDDRSPAEIGAREGMPASTVRSRLARATARLRGELERRHGRGPEGWLAIVAPLTRPALPVKEAATAPSAAPALKLAAVLIITVSSIGLLARAVGGSTHPATPSPRPTSTTAATTDLEGTALVARTPLAEATGRAPSPPPMNDGSTTELRDADRRRLVGHVRLGDGTPAPEDLEVVALDVHGTEHARALTGPDGGFEFAGAPAHWTEFEVRAKSRVLVSEVRIRRDPASGASAPGQAGSTTVELTIDALLVGIATPTQGDVAAAFGWTSFGDGPSRGRYMMRTPSDPFLLATGPGYRFEHSGEDFSRFGFLAPGLKSGAYTVELRPTVPELGTLVLERAGVSLDFPSRVTIDLDPIAGESNEPDDSVSIRFAREGETPTVSEHAGRFPGRFRTSARVFQLAGETVPARARVEPEEIVILADSRTTLRVTVERAAGMQVRLRSDPSTVQRDARITREPLRIEARPTGTEEWMGLSLGWRSSEDEWTESYTVPLDTKLFSQALDPGATDVRLLRGESVHKETRVVLADGAWTPVEFQLAP